MSWHAELDGALERQTAKLATPISEAFKNAIDVHQIVTDWFNTHPYGTFTRQQAIDWARTNIHVKTRLLIDPIKTIHATGWAYGVNFGQQAYARARLNLLKAPGIEDLKLAVNFDWTNWKPGDTAAAMKATPPKGLGRLWQDKLFLSSVDRYGLTAINQMGIILADSLKLGTTSLEVTRNLVAADLQDLRDSGWRALRIARTELNRALNTATMDTYQTNGVEYVEWLADEEGDCKICPSFADLGAVPIGYQFDEDITEPPAHPNCRCTILPAFPQDQVAKMIQKFNENHDAQGRFSSSNESGESVKDSSQADDKVWDKITDKAIKATGKILDEPACKALVASTVGAALQANNIPLIDAMQATGTSFTEQNITELQTPNTGTGLANMRYVEITNTNIHILTGEEADFPRSREQLDIVNPGLTSDPNWRDNITAEQFNKWVDYQNASYEKNGVGHTYAPGDPRAVTAAYGAAASNLTAIWAETSNNSNEVSLAIQQVANNTFGLNNTFAWNKDNDLQQIVDQRIANYGHVYQVMLQSQYDTTQQFLKDQNIKDVTLYRGIKYYSNTKTTSENNVEVSMRPLSSFSTDRQTSLNFAISVATRSTSVRSRAGIATTDR